MVENDILRWGLHELEGSGYVANDAGSSYIKPVLHEVPQGRVGNNVDNRGSGIEPASQVIIQPIVERVEIRNTDIIRPVNEVAQPRIELPTVEISSSDIIPVNKFGEPLVRAPFRHPEPPSVLPPNTANDAVIAQALHEEFQKLAAAEAAGQPCKEKV